MSNRHCSSTVLSGVVAIALSAAAIADANVVLRGYCPPGFELAHGNVCELRTLYQGYDSLRNSGVGGLKTALPEVRDGFSPQQIDLGRYLFFDPLLSGDNTLSCASCHHPDLGFSDGRPRSVGIGGAEVRRAAPSLWNVGFQQKLFWDARADSLEQQLTGPLYDAQEMGSSPAQLLADISGNETYRRLFREAYPNNEDPPTLDLIYHAITAFQASLISLNSRYDRYAHTPPLFTNQQIAVIGVRDPEGVAFDEGAQAVTGNPGLRGGFKIPSLRNVARTAPYMHSGAFGNLRDAAEFYTLGRGHALPEEEKQRMIVHWHIWEPQLADDELDRLVDFMGALTDESFKPTLPDALAPQLGRTN
jgi:cytochrome c peroxidase